VRDPVDRALSQHQHHLRDGDEVRPVEEALLDPDSQYEVVCDLTTQSPTGRGKYFEHVRPFLDRLQESHILVLVQERLRDEWKDELRRLFAHARADPAWWSHEVEQRWHVGE
jgi:hypothetical protein